MLEHLRAQFIQTGVRHRTARRLGIYAGLSLFLLGALLASMLYITVLPYIREYPEAYRAVRESLVLDIVLTLAASVVLGYAVYFVRGRALRAEKSRASAQRRLEISEQRYRQLSEAANDAVCALDASGRILYWNKAAAHCFGYSASEVSGEVFDRLLLPDISRSDFKRLLMRKRQGPTAPEDDRLEFIARRRDGSTCCIECSLASILVDGNWQGVAIMRDISARKRDEAALELALEDAAQSQKKLTRTNAELEEAMVRAQELTAYAEAANLAKSQFLASMSHEIRTPLNGILGHAQVILGQHELKPKLRESAETILKSGEHLLTLINDLLDISKIESGKLELANETFNLPAFVRGLDDMMRVRARQKGLLYLSRPYDFSANEPGGKLPRYVIGDEKRLRQVLVNLLGNAIKFTEKGSVMLKVGRVSVPNREGKSTLRFLVEDTGVGIPEQDHERVFEAFAQSNAGSSQAEGTGLGLPISRNLVVMMGGELRMESTPGIGTRFWFDVDLPADISRSIKVADDGDPIVGYAGGRKRVLVVEDIKDNRSALTELLAGLGFELDEADSAPRALRIIARRIPDLIITDLIMPQMSGQELIRKVRSQKLMRGVPIIAVSADLAPSQVESATTAGCDVFIPKPVRARELLYQIGHLLHLDWIYEQDARRESVHQASSISEKPFPKTDLPAKPILKKMYALAMMGDLLSLRDYAEEISQEGTCTDFARRVGEMARNFESARLCALLAELVEKPATPKIIS